MTPLERQTLDALKAAFNALPQAQTIEEIRRHRLIIDAMRALRHAQSQRNKEKRVDNAARLAAPRLYAELQTLTTIFDSKNLPLYKQEALAKAARLLKAYKLAN